MTISAADPEPSTAFVRRIFMNDRQTLATRTTLMSLALFCFFFIALSSQTVSSEELMEFRGQTMGTTYSVKVAPPHELPDDVALDIDAELRSVNDQMSTYLRSSEISKFNDSPSTDWFDVSAETARVVAFAQRVSRDTDGAFDVTVGPLVDAWSFGPAPRSRRVPSDAKIDDLRGRIGYQKLSVREDPPAIKKATPELRIDLSAIAKGHGVDRVVALLLRSGAENVFVEIGGEVRAFGQKPEGPWKVGIQDPAFAENRPTIAYPLVDRSIATSGDYRNFFEIDGVRYSHTIDPRTGRPVTHDLASVSVLADTCMAADAWATAVNVVGAEEGLRLAERNDLDALVFRQTPDGFASQGVGVLADYQNEDAEQAPLVDRKDAYRQILSLAFVSTIFLGIVVTGMAVGVMFGRKSIGGSCGGLANQQNEDGSTSCSLCSNPSDACKELREKMEQNQPAKTS